MNRACVRVGFWQNGFFADFYFWAAGFFRGFSRRIFFPHFCGKKCPKNPPGKSPQKSSKICTTKILRHISAEWPGQHVSKEIRPSRILQLYIFQKRRRECTNTSKCRQTRTNAKSENFAEIQSTTLFGDHPFSIKHPQDNFGLQNVNWRPPKCKLTPSKKGLATSNLQFLYRNTQKSPLDNLYFGGRQLHFWGLKLSWGRFIEKGGPPKRVVLWLLPRIAPHFAHILLRQPKKTVSWPLKALTSLNKEVRPFFLGDNSIWRFPSVSSLSDYSIWGS